MNEITGTLKTTIVYDKENEHTYEIKRLFEGVKGDDLIILQLFPTLGEGDEFTMDSTTLHMINHFRELNISSIRFINLFSKRCKARMSTRNIILDEENLKYIESIMKEANFKKYKFVVAFGCSMNSSSVAKQTKHLIFEMFKKHNPAGTIYQITTNDLSQSKNSAVHVLFLGIRYSNAKWRLSEYTIPIAIDKAHIISKTNTKSSEKGSTKE
ncbi:DUF1643 domain-containing protein [[Clostridium] fimetarium]|uniref:DUF1643 domain-containing protein n=1 Tax=[Clostridium] fimetarium TaxID=99656 RepID=A0A1I0MYK8_9FIRM|nr:DUF1643 domain-containing protein [[Clostridium] fimetarium]SEV93609.1 Protein of unknown function [[Clostridium] fimetarium]